MNARQARPAMGIAMEQTKKNKILYKRFLDAFDGADVSAVKSAAQEAFRPNAHIDAAHPINETRGGDGYVEDIIAPMSRGLRGFQRRNDMLIGGEYLGHEWVTSIGYFCGHFTAPMFGSRQVSAWSLSVSENFTAWNLARLFSLRCSLALPS